MDFNAWLESLGFTDESTLSDAQRVKLTAKYEAEKGNRGDGKPKSFADTVAEERAELARSETIATMGRDAIRECPLYIDQIERAVQDAIDGKMSAKDFELDLLRNMRSKAGTFRATMRNTANDPKVIEAALSLASGLPDIEKHYKPEVLEAVDRSGMRQFGLQQMLLNIACANGYRANPGERITVGNLRSVLEFAFPPAMARLSGFSTVSAPNILGSVAQKQILAGYMEEDQTWREIAEIRAVSNFFTQNYYRMLDSLEYEEVGSGGEIKHGTLGEETYTSTAKTYGKMLGITRTQIINDDQGAFADLRTRLGRGAGKKFANVFWAAFINNSSFYTTALTNYIEGSTTNLGTDGVGIGLMVKAFRTMTSPAADGTKRVGQDINATKILIPPELEGNGRMQYVNNNIGAVAMGTGVNLYPGMFKPVVQWRLSNTSYTGYSTTAWYMFGDQVRPMLVTFLNGQQSPTVESTDADFNTLGIQFRGYHDFGCDKSEYLAGIKSKGAA